MADLGTFETLLVEVGKGLLPLKKAVSSPSNFRAFMLKLGWQADDIPQPLQDLGAGLDVLFSELRGIVGDGLAVDGSVSLDSASSSTNVTIDDIMRLKNAVEQIVNGIEAIATAPDAAIPAPLRDEGFRDKFPEQLISYLLIDYLTTHQSSWAFAFRALGIVKTKYVAPTGGRLPYVDYSIDFSDIPKVLETPEVVLENAFGWGLDDFDYRAFVSQVDNLLSSVGVDVFVEEMRSDIASSIEGDVDIPGDPVRRVTKGVFFERARPSGRMAAEMRLLYLPKKNSQKPGFALMPAFNGLLDFKMQLGADIAVNIKSDLDLQGGAALLLRPDEPIEMVLGFNNAGTPVFAKGSLLVGVERSQLDDSPILILGSKDGTRLQYRKLSGAAGVSLDRIGAVNPFAEFETKGIEFVFKPNEADHFIQRFFPPDGAVVGFDLALGISYLQGFYFRGSSHFEIAVPAHIRIGPIDLQSLTVAAIPQAGKMPINIGVGFKAELGPLTAVVENIGLSSTFSFPERGGNLGPMDLDFAFKPPNGVGLAIDTPAVKGGGYLFIDAERGEYAGALELTFSNAFALKAIGLITTKMPDGSKGFSLLIIITAEFGTGIQLGFGFTLLAVGGLIGLNRTMKLQPLMEGVRTGAVNGIMFPRDVVANAPRIISDLRTIFPPQEGTFLIGPMAKLAWGTPALISLSLGIIIEIPGNIAILGVLRVALPADEAAVLVLQVNFAGAIEFDKRRIYFFAALFESRMLFMTIDGEMALLVAFGDDANFVASVGGFHPRFNPPPLPVPSPRRVSVNLVNSPSARVRIEGYFAVTSNTAQFGARAELFFGLDEVNVEGHLGFDALFQFSPFYVVIAISASFSVKVFGAGLFSVRIRGSLEGPTPWRASGEGSISLLFFDISVDFAVTWGEDRDTMLPPVAVMPLFKAEFEKDENWRALLPASNNLLVSLRKMPPEEAALVLHPVGVLRVTQRALPLELKLDKVGNQKPSDVDRLSVAIVDGALSKKGDTFEQFAPAQFENLNDGDRLSRPAFEPEQAGLDLSAAGADLRSSGMVKRVVRYEEIILDTNFKRFSRRFFSFSSVLFDHFLNGASVAKSDLSLAKKKQFQPFEEKIEVRPETYTVAYQSNNKAYAADSVSFTSKTSARDYLAREVANDANLSETLHVIPSYEGVA